MLKLLLILLLTGFIAVEFPACAPQPTTPGVTSTQDPVAAAETALRVAKDTFDLFLKLERQNDVWIKANAPLVHDFAEKLRREAPDLLIKANAAKNAYKHSPSPENASSLVTIMSLVSELVSQAAQNTAKIPR